MTSNYCRQMVHDMETSIKKQKAQVFETVFVVEHFEDGALILNTFDARMIKVNQSGSKILQLLESGCSKNEVADELARFYDIAIEDAMLAVELLHSQLVEHGTSIESFF